MKIIELMNKISNGEEVPKKIKFCGNIWTYDCISKDYIGDGQYLFMDNICNFLNVYCFLNAELEIAEDKPKTLSKLNEVIDKVNNL